MSTRPRFALTPFDQIAVDTRSHYLVKGLIPRVGLTVVWGERKAWKSFWVLDLAMHIATGRDYRGRRVRGGPVVYCVLEGAHRFPARVEAARLKFVPDSSANRPQFALMMGNLNLVRDQKAFIESLRQQVGHEPPVAIVIDTLNRSFEGSESDDKDMTAYIRAADAVREAFDCSVIVVHHCGHDGARPRGHSSLGGALDVQISVKRAAGDRVVAEVELAKDGPTGAKIVSRVKEVVVCKDDDGDDITTLVVEPADGDQARADDRSPVKRRPATQEIALAALRALSAETPDGVAVEEWRKQCYADGISPAKPQARQKAFLRAVHQLAAANLATVIEGRAFLTC